MKIYENCIHGAKTISELEARGITKCDKCHGTVMCPSSNCLFHLDCEPLYGEKEPYEARVGGFCTTTTERYNYDVVRYGKGRI